MEQSVDHICGPRQMKAYMDRVMAPKLEELGLVPSSAPFICEIARSEGISLRGLSEHLMVDKAHSTRVVSKLLDLGLVENRAEGHEYSLYVTDSGRKAADRAMRIMHDAWSDLIRDLTPEEIDSLTRILNKMSKTIREENR
ncbi:MarR family transcriptional regulator [methanogenic archaeon mixed culture ISO4-G1]|nr:MarR family transcriptional regulator [methanogenic archaeon mixed culture ISO4-G1]